MNGLADRGPPSPSPIDSPSPIAHHGEIVEGCIVDVSIDIIAVKSGVVHHPLDKKSSVALTAIGTSLIKVMTNMMRNDNELRNEMTIN